MLALSVTFAQGGLPALRYLPLSSEPGRSDPMMKTAPSTTKMIGHSRSVSIEG